MRGHVQVRVAELSATHATLLTLEGHPLAGAVRFRCDRVDGIVRFQVEVFDRPANVLDLDRDAHAGRPAPGVTRGKRWCRG